MVPLTSRIAPDFTLQADLCGALTASIDWRIDIQLCAATQISILAAVFLRKP
jgi:hypothetical protein